KAAVEPDYTRWIDPYAPFVKIISPRRGEILRGGSKVQIRWVASDDNLLDRPIKIELMRDGAGVMVVANATENDGEYDFEFPYNKGAYSVRISATDRAGHVTSADTGEFLIDTGVPRVSIEIMDDEGNALPAVVYAPEPAPRAGVEKKDAPASVPVEESVEREPDKPQKVALPQKTVGPKAADANEHMLRGRELLEMGQIESAITELAKASEYFPNNDAIINEYGIALFRKQMYTQALLNFQRAKELAPGETRYVWNNFLAYYELGNAEGAAQSALLVLKSDGAWTEGGDMIDAVMLLYQNKGETGKIAEFLEQVLKIEHLSEKIKEHIRARVE
ncbi:MAG: Ig-like domain-containing protein, partial [Planctomycetota bacterium]